MNYSPMINYVRAPHDIHISILHRSTPRAGSHSSRNKSHAARFPQNMGMGAFLAYPCTCPLRGIQGSSRSIFLHNSSFFLLDVAAPRITCTTGPVVFVSHF
jgi:hypothetical protein